MSLNAQNRTHWGAYAYGTLSPLGFQCRSVCFFLSRAGQVGQVGRVGQVGTGMGRVRALRSVFCIHAGQYGSLLRLGIRSQAISRTVPSFPHLRLAPLGVPFATHVVIRSATTPSPHHRPTFTIKPLPAHHWGPHRKFASNV